MNENQKMKWRIQYLLYCLLCVNTDVKSRAEPFLCLLCQGSSAQPRCSHCFRIANSSPPARGWEGRSASRTQLSEEQQLEAARAGLTGVPGVIWLSFLGAGGCPMTPLNPRWMPRGRRDGSPRPPCTRAAAPGPRPRGSPPPARFAGFFPAGPRLPAPCWLKICSFFSSLPRIPLSSKTGATGRF